MEDNDSYDLPPAAGYSVSPRAKERRALLWSLFLCFLLGTAFLGEWVMSAFAIAEDPFSDMTGDRMSDCPEDGQESGLTDPNASGQALFEMLPSLCSEGDAGSALALYDRLYTGQSAQPVGDSGRYTIVSSDLSGFPAEGEFLLSNETRYTPDLYALCEAADARRTVRALFQTDSFSSEEQPLVLILHTHGTEAYAEEGALSYPENALPRSENPDENVVAVGKVLCDTLNECGVPAIHCTVMHDRESYIRSYDLARETILAYLERYPSLAYVFDVHRDAILRPDTHTMVKTVSYRKDGTADAQIMFVVGTDQNGALHPDWETNLSFALTLQKALSERQESLVRPVNLRASSFNEQYTPGSLLIEIGTCANTLEESKRSAVLLGEEMARQIRGE